MVGTRVVSVDSSNVPVRNNWYSYTNMYKYIASNSEEITIGWKLRLHSNVFFKRGVSLDSRDVPVWNNWFYHLNASEFVLTFQCKRSLARKGVKHNQLGYNEIKARMRYYGTFKASYRTSKTKGIPFVWNIGIGPCFLISEKAILHNSEPMKRKQHKMLSL